MILLLVFLAASARCEILRYDGYQVYRVIPNNEEQVQKLGKIQATGKYDFWKTVSDVNEPVDILISPSQKSYFNEVISTYKMNAEKKIDDVQKLIEESVPKERATGSFGWSNYYRMQDMYNWMDSLATQYPDKVSVLNAGNTYQNRPIKGVKINFKPTNKIIFIEGGIHAREWISPATVTYMLNQILTNQTQSVRTAVESYNWYIFPIFNPDGYEFTFTWDRLWRKNRQPWRSGIIPFFLCRGTDLNRNWNYHWMQSGGASSFPCSQTYAGGSVNSAPEVARMSDLLTPLGSNMSVYLSYHSYGQYILLPYGDTNTLQGNDQELLKIGQNAAVALAQRYGTNYTVGSNIDLLKYVVTGDSGAWVKSVLKTPIVLTYELRDKGNYGFLLPRSQIIPSGEETFDSLLSIVQQAIAKGY